MCRIGFTVLFFLFLGLLHLPAQEIQLKEEPNVSQLMQQWVNSNRAMPEIDGWRVQIMASTDRLAAEQARNRFRLEYPETAATVVQEQPYYKLRIGAFRTKQEAQLFITQLTGYAGAYPAKDPRIHPRDFLEQ